MDLKLRKTTKKYSGFQVKMEINKYGEHDEKRHLV